MAALGVTMAILAAACGGGGDDDSTPPVAASKCTPVGAADAPVEIVSRWATGDVQPFTLTTTREDAVNPSRNGTGTTTLEVRVMEAGDDGSRLAWESGDTIVDLGAELGADEQAAFEELSELGRFSIEYSTDQSGAFDLVENLDALRSQVERIIAKLEELGGDAPELAESAAAMRDVMLSDTFLQTSLVENVLIFHGAYGLVLEPDETITTPDELPNVLGGRPFPATSSVAVLTPRDGDGCAVVEVIVTPEPDAAAEILTETLTELVGEDDSEAMAEELRGFTIRNTIRYVYDPTSGWMVRVEAEQVIEIGAARRLERKVIEAT